MAPTKRKAVTDERPSKKAKATSAYDAVAGSREAGAGASAGKYAKGTKATATNGSEKKSATKSILQQEERAFPRGGGSVLTPLEHRQIKAQAEQDVLLEQENDRAGSPDEKLLNDSNSRGQAAKSRKSRKVAVNRPSNQEDSGPKIIGLSYKNLLVGGIVLGRVTSISSKDVALALPNNLTGFVPITNVSKKLNSRIEKLLADEDESLQDSDNGEADVDLKQLFHVGQWLRAAVISMSTASTEHDGKTKRHIELTLDPTQVNGKITPDSASINGTIQASVRSVEDHGLVMDLGFSDNDVNGFISKKELGTAYNIQDMQEGQVLLCLVTGKSSSGKVLKLCPDTARFSVATPSNDKEPVLNDAPNLNAYQPGTAAMVLVTESGAKGVAAKLMGMLDVVADTFHSAASDTDGTNTTYKVGSKVKARITWSLPADDGSQCLGISLLEHLLALPPASSRLPQNATQKQRVQAAALDQELTTSSFIETATVTEVSPDHGLSLQLQNPAGPAEPAFAAFAHISQVSDTRVDSLSRSTGLYKIGSTHRARIISFNPVDNLYYVSLKPSILAQPFLRIEDLKVGELVKGSVDKILLGGTSGVVGILIRLSDSITALVPEVHLSDTQLKHPERKFREGLSVKARVLSVDFDKRQARLTLKKSLVEIEDQQSVWKDYASLQPGMLSKGTIAKLLPKGAIVQFFGSVRAWLPIAQMSEAFVHSPEQHFRPGQTVSVRILSVNAEKDELKVTCKDNETFDANKQLIWDAISIGDVVSGIVTGKTISGVSIELHNGLRGTISVGHLVDKSVAKSESTLLRTRMDQRFEELLVLQKLPNQTLRLSCKASMVKDAKSGNLIKSFEDAIVGKKVRGFVRAIADFAVYIEFANGIVGMLPKSQILPELLDQPDFGLRADQSIATWVIHADSETQRISLSLREKSAVQATATGLKPATPSSTNDVDEPVDKTIVSMADFVLGKVTKARVASVKATQVNVRLARNVQGRIDMSEAFDTWDETGKKGIPLLQKYKQGDIIEVKILGMHDARNYRFLPISHRQGKVPVFELSAKRSRIEQGSEALLTMESMSPDSSHLAFVNNHGQNHVWVTLSPNVRGQIALMDLSDDVGALQAVERYFPKGSALRVRVKLVDAATNRLDLTAKQDTHGSVSSLQDLSLGMVLAGRVTKVTDRSLIVQLSDSLVGSVTLTDLHDDYDQAVPTQYEKNDIVRVCVTSLDLPNKRVWLSTRPSKVLSSTLPVKDAHITHVAQLKLGSVVRGFVKQISEKGVFIALGARVDALVKISDLSDKFIKDWKSICTVDQLVKGRVIFVDQASNQIQLTLKNSQVDENYHPPMTINDLEIGQVVTGKVRKVEDFGAFIDIDDTQPRLSGLCHRSEVAARRVDDVRKLYSTGDVVKVKILQIDVQQRKLSLGLKASYFKDADDHGEDIEEEDRLSALEHGSATDDDMDGGVSVEAFESEAEDEPSEDSMDIDDTPAKPSSGLQVGGFDWTGNSLEADANGAASESEFETNALKKRKRNKPQNKVDMTGELDKYGPQSVSDFERQLLGQPNKSGLWIQYMAFQLQVSEIQKAREIAERALRTIHIRETEEKANIWIAWLNLEVEYGDAERVDDVFKQACQLQDSLEMHEKLASIYIDSGKHSKADSVFEQMIGNKAFRASPNMWYNYATFLMDTLHAPDRARALLSRALQSISNHEHRSLTAKFAALEFHSAQGDVERGRTIFEGLMSEWPKWTSGWDMWVDLERSRIASADSDSAKNEARDHTRALFDRMAAQKIKKRRAKFVFKKWLEFEESEGNAKHTDRVKALAKEYVEKHQATGDDDLDE